MLTISPELPAEVDCLVLGTGIAGICAALRADALGLRTLVAEKTDRFGGSTALSGGLLWIPNNPLLAEDGVDDSFEKSMTYLDTVVGDDAGPAASPQRREAFVRNGPELVSFLRQLGAKLARCTGYSDYFPEQPGGMPEGRAVRGAEFDTRDLGDWEPLLRQRQLFPGLVVHMEEISPALTAATTGRGIGTVAKVAARTATALARRRRIETLGAGLMAQLLNIARLRGMDLRTNLALDEVLVADGSVRAAVLRRADGSTTTVRASSIVLACGGFAHNEALRKEFGKQPVSTDWTLASPGDTGDGILAGRRVGGAVALMDEAIWMGTGTRPDGTREMHVFDRSLPHSIVVDSSGSRFVNEATDYVRFGQAIYERHKTVPCVPSWLIIDGVHRRHYLLGDALPRLVPRASIKGGYIKKASTLHGLAQQCGIDAGGLEATVARFNSMAAAGRDYDFGRGDTHFDRYFGDPSNRPNANLGTIDTAPFYAVPVYPGDVGTAGGLLCDEHAQVIHEDGSVIRGLYAVGNTAATPMGHSYPGPGASIGIGAVFGFIAASHAARITSV